MLSGYVPSTVVLVKFNFHGVVVLHDAIYWRIPLRSWRVSTIVNKYSVHTVCIDMFEICPRSILVFFLWLMPVQIKIETKKPNCQRP